MKLKELLKIIPKKTAIYLFNKEGENLYPNYIGHKIDEFLKYSVTKLTYEEKLYGDGLEITVVEPEE